MPFVEDNIQVEAPSMVVVSILTLVEMERLNGKRSGGHKFQIVLHQSLQSVGRLQEVSRL